MFEHESVMKEMAEIFSALSSDCRIEIIYLLMRIDSLPSGEIGKLTNCTPSQISQYLAKMYSAGIVTKKRTWREIEYSLDRSNQLVQNPSIFFSHHLKD